MKVVFVLGAHEIIGAEYVAAMARVAGIEVDSVYDAELFDDLLFINRPLARLLDRKRRVVNAIIDAKPDLVAFSIATPNLRWALSIANGVKAVAPIPIVFGGIHPSAVPDRVLKNECVDFAVVGEGEFALVDLARALESGDAAALESVANLWYRRDGVPTGNPLRPLNRDLDALPYPDKSIYYRHVPAYAHCYKLTAARGCPHTCTFCYHSWWREMYKGDGGYVRRRSVDAVIEELKEAKRRWNPQIVRFNDEDLSHHKGWIAEFTDRYRREIGLPFWCYSHPATMDADKARMLKEAGCYRTELGVQAIWDESKKILGRVETVDQIRESFRVLREAGVPVAADNLFYVPGQTIEELEDMARFYNDNRVDITQNAALHYFPRIPIIETAKTQGVLSEERVRDLNEAPADRMVLYASFEFDKTVERLRAYMSLLLLLPKRVNDVIIRRRWWRFIPILHPIFVFGFVSAFHAPKADYWYERRHKDRYRRFISLRLREAFGFA